MKCLYCDNLAECPELGNEVIDNVVCTQCFMDGLKISFMNWFPPIAASRLIHVDDLKDWMGFVVKVNTKSFSKDCSEYDLVLGIMEYRLDLIRVTDRSLYDSLRSLWS